MANKLTLTPDPDNTPLAFGKYKGKSPGEVAEIDPGYIVWLYAETDRKGICSKALYRACKAELEENDDYDPLDEAYKHILWD